MPRLLPTLLALVALAGCGGEDEEPQAGPVPASELAGLLPDDTRAAAHVDIRAAREALGLPPGADPLEEKELLFPAGLAIGPLQAPNETPVRQAIDFGRVGAAAGGSLGAPNSVNVLATSQPFDQIQGALEKSGKYEESDGVLAPAGEPEPGAIPEPYVGGREGVVVLGGSAEAVKGALERKPATTDLTRALGLVRGPVRSAALGAGGDCVTAYAASDQVRPQAGQIVIDTAGTGDPDAFRLNARRVFGPEVKLGTAIGGTGEVRVRWEASQRPALTPVGLAFADLQAASIYACR